MKKVIIIQKELKNYRIEFFNLLREKLLQHKVNLLVIYGQPETTELYKNDNTFLEWGLYKTSTIIKLGKKRLYWQPILRYIGNSDLVIVEQASKLLINYILFFYHLIKINRLAFWGHGKNLQEPTINRFSEFIKKIISRNVDWWFAYTSLSVDIVKELGFPSDRITNVQNAINTKELIQEYERLKKTDLENLRLRLGFKNNNICLFIGGMYPEKRIEFLINSLKIVKEKISNFEMIFIGAGVDDFLVKETEKRMPWIHYLGTKFGKEKVPYFMISKLLLIPGQVGLAILDSFALETPLVTTKTNVHAPEIGYLVNNYNGVMSENPNDVEVYAEIIVNLLTDRRKLKMLKEGCRFSRNKYSLENMVENFSSGILQALGDK
jgi:glycosyltransferase involved in cell wall biosynthesis